MPTRCFHLPGVIALALVAVAAPAPAQTHTARITGAVRDGSGAPLAGATVTAASLETGATASARTANDGEYALWGLPQGAHTVWVSLIGYRRAVQRNVLVTDEAVVEFVLEPLPLQAVIVTATHREQSLRDVPFSVAAPTGAALRARGAENMEAIAASVAGFTVQNLGPGQNQVAIRGASSGQIARDQPGVKEQVGVYLDGSPVSLSLFTPDLDLFDVSRVEVLRGPQGTLFGAGSLAGTVRYITNQPELEVARTFGELAGSWVAGGTPASSVKLGTNLPIGDRAAARVAVYHNQLSGFMDAVQPDLSVRQNHNTGTRTGVRGALLFAPTDRLRIVPRLVYQSVAMDGWNRIDAYNILANPYTTSRPAIALGERELFTQIDEPYDDDFFLGDLDVQYDVGGVRLTSITSISHRDLLVVRDGGAQFASVAGGDFGMPEDIYTLDARLDDVTKVNGWAQEVRLAGGGERMRWLLGGFYGRSRRDYGQSVMIRGFQASTGMPTEGLQAGVDEVFFSDLAYDLRQVAVFGEGTVTLGGRLDLTAGLRYYDFGEDREQVFDGIFAHENTGTSVVSVPGSTGANGFAPRFIASFRARDGLTLNAQAARGVRLGGINDPLNVPLCTAEDLQTFSDRDAWTDETVWNYEVGAKSQWFGGVASLDMAVFYMDIRDLQLTVTAGSCSSRLVFNVPESVSRGVEVELAIAPSPYFDVAASATFNDSQLRSTLTSTDSSGAVSIVSGIESGNRLPSVPRVQAAVSATVRRPLGSGATLFLTGAFTHVGSRYTQIDDHAEGFGTVDLNSFPNAVGGPFTASTFTFDPELPAYDLLNVRVGVSRAGWEGALFLNNVTDERAFLALDRERGTRARVGYLTNQPRTIGVMLGFDH